MEIAKIEVAAVEKTVSEVEMQNIVELHDLQLALVGGGIGEVIVG
jgi:hypothetical protein